MWTSLGKSWTSSFLKIILFFKKSSPEDKFIDEREKERNMDERDISVASHTRPDQESKPSTFQGTGRCSHQLSHPARAELGFVII